MTLPVKSIDEIEVKSEVSVNDKILILDSESEEARLASKDELKGDKGDKGDTGETGATGPQGPKGDKGDKGDTGAKGDKGDKGDKGSKGDKGDTGAKGDKGDTGAKGDKGDKGNTGATGPSIVSAAFSGNDIVFTKDDSNTVTLTDAKTELKGDKGDKGDTGSKGDTGNTGPQGEQGEKGDTGATGASIVSAAFSSNDIVFTKDDSNTVTLADAKTTLKGDKGNTGDTGATGNGITEATSSKDGKTTTVVLHYTNGDTDSFQVQDGADGQGSGDMNMSTYDPNSKMADAFNYNNFINTPTKVSDFQNDSGFVTNAVNDLTNYYLKTETYTKAEVNSLVQNFQGFEVVATLPSSDIKTNVIYLKGPSGSGTDQYEEWIYSNSNWVKIGDTSVDLTNYATKTEVNAKQDILTAGRNIDLTNNTANLKLIEVTVTTAHDTAAKIGTTTAGNYTPTVGDLLLVNFVNGCYVNNPTIDIDGSGAKYIMVGGIRASSVSFPCGSTAGVNTKIIMYYDGTYYRSYGMFGGYSSMTKAEIDAGTATGNRVISPANLIYAIEHWDKDQVSDDAYSAAWDGETDLAPSQNAVYDKISTMDTTIAGKQDALTTQTAYSSKGTSTKVATITTNSLGQVTGITETDITFPVTSVNGSIGAVTGLQTTANLKTNLTDNSDSYYPSQKAVKTAVDSKQDTLVNQTNIKSINGNSLLGSGDLAVSGLPSGGTAGQVVTKTNDGAAWADPSGGIENDTTGTTTTVAKIWAGTEAEYSDLATKDEDVIYFTY